MMYRLLFIPLIFTVMLLLSSGNVIGDSRLEKSEDRVISATGISQIRFRDISRSDLIYKGIDSAENQHRPGIKQDFQDSRNHTRHEQPDNNRR